MSERKYYAVVLTEGDNANFFRDDVHETEAAAVKRHMEYNANLGAGPEEGWAIVEFTGIKSLELVLKPKLKALDPASYVRKEEGDGEE